MFRNMIPWKRPKREVAVHTGSPTAEEYYPLNRIREEFDSLWDRFLEAGPPGTRFFEGMPSLMSRRMFT